MGVYRYVTVRPLVAFQTFSEGGELLASKPDCKVENFEMSTWRIIQIVSGVATKMDSSPLPLDPDYLLYNWEPADVMKPADRKLRDSQLVELQPNIGAFCFSCFLDEVYLVLLKVQKSESG